MRQFTKDYPAFSLQVLYSRFDLCSSFWYEKLKAWSATSSEEAVGKLGLGSLFVNYLIREIWACYTAGYGVDYLRKYLVPRYLELGLWGPYWPADAEHRIKHGTAHMFVGDDYFRILHYLSIAVLFEADLKYFQRAARYIDKNKVKDNLLEFLLQAKLPEREFPVVPSYDEFGQRNRANKAYQPLREVVYARGDRAKASELMAHYCKTWYRHKSNLIIMHFGVHKDTPHLHRGYWNFEALALTRLLGLDDSNYCNHPYYPRDLLNPERSLIKCKPLTEGAYRGYCALPGHINRMLREQLAENIGGGWSNCMGQFEYITRGSFEWAEGDYQAAKNSWAIFARLYVLVFIENDWYYFLHKKNTGEDIRPAGGIGLIDYNYTIDYGLYLLLSDHPQVIQEFAELHLPIESYSHPLLMNQQADGDYPIRLKTLQAFLLGDQERIDAEIERLRARRAEIRVHRDYWGPDVLPDYDFFIALYEKNEEALNAVLKDMLKPEFHTERNPDPMLNPYLNLPALGYAKLAVRLGYSIRVESKYLPPEFLEIKPNEKYDLEYKFLQDLSWLEGYKRQMGEG